MFQFLYIFGPAAITWLIIRKLSDKSAPDLITGLVEMIAYAVLDAALTTLLLYPFGRVEFVINSEGIRDIRYGFVAFFVSMILAVLIGIILAAIEKRMDFELQIIRADRHKTESRDKKNAAVYHDVNAAAKVSEPLGADTNANTNTGIRTNTGTGTGTCIDTGSGAAANTDVFTK
ncbi:MAG: hypothetical protein LUG99_14530 [Lachnospiraceae bacterium]|nr:hypothetical protein [Lachnospiraceae bacterium]